MFSLYTRAPRLIFFFNLVFHLKLMSATSPAHRPSLLAALNAPRPVAVLRNVHRYVYHF